MSLIYHMKLYTLTIWIRYHEPCTIYSTWGKQQYGLRLRKFDKTNFPQTRFELESMGWQASVLPIEPLLLVSTAICCFLPSRFYKTIIWPINNEGKDDIFLVVRSINLFNLKTRACPWNCPLSCNIYPQRPGECL